MSNSVRVIGNLGKNAEKKMFEGGKSVVNFSVADTRKWKKVGKDNKMESQERTIWWNCSSSNAEKIAEYMLKGKMVLVEGNMDIDKWTDKNQVEHSMPKIWVTNIELLDKKKENEPDAPNVDPETGELKEPVA